MDLINTTIIFLKILLVKIWRPSFYLGPKAAASIASHVKPALALILFFAELQILCMCVTFISTLIYSSAIKTQYTLLEHSHQLLYKCVKYTFWPLLHILNQKTYYISPFKIVYNHLKFSTSYSTRVNLHRHYSMCI